MSVRRVPVSVGMCAAALLTVHPTAQGSSPAGGVTAGLPPSARVLLVPSSPTPISPAGVPPSSTASLRVAIAGSGPAVVLLPGLFGSAYGYRNLIPLLEEAGYQAIVVEPLGVGGSARPEHADYSLTAQAERVAAVLPQLGVERAVVVGHSAAASIAFRMAVRHPGRVSAVLSIDGGAPEMAATPGFRRALRFARLLRIFGGRRLLRGKVRDTLVGGAADPSWVTEDVVTGYMDAAAADLGATLRAYKQMANAREPEAIQPRLTEIRCPARLLLGAVPHRGGPGAAEVALLQQRFPALIVERVPGAGHFVYEEKPAAVVAAVRAVLSVPPRVD